LAARTILSEIGTDMSRFLSAGLFSFIYNASEQP